jgi:hypothetical protein
MVGALWSHVLSRASASDVKLYKFYKRFDFPLPPPPQWRDSLYSFRASSMSSLQDHTQAHHTQ